MDLISTSIWFWLLAIIGVLLTGISKSGFAAGGGVLVTPLIALVIPVNQAVFFALPLLIVMDIKIIHYYYKNIDIHQIKQIIPAAIIGIGIGGLSIGHLSAEFLSLTLGIICIIFSIWQPLINWLTKFKNLGIFWGMVAGFTSTLIHTGGPPLNIYLMSQKLPKLVWLSTGAIFFGVVNLIKIIPYVLTGEWKLDLFLTSLLLIPVAFFGAFLGKYIQSFISETRFLLLCRILLLFSGIILIFKVLF